VANPYVLCHVFYETPNIILQYRLAFDLWQFDSLWNTLVDYIKMVQDTSYGSVAYWVVIILIRSFGVRFRIKLIAYDKHG
jgi:hypothetical protein